MTRALRIAATLAIAICCTPGAAAAVGFQRATAEDAGFKPVPLAIWYPSGAAAQPEQFGPFRQTVAINGAVAGGGHALIVMSHGSGGSAFDSADTAWALADAGFIVAAVTHNGDNFKDHSQAFTRRNFVDRARHLSRTLDYMLGTWPGRAAVDPSRIGVFGHSAGATSALIVLGGRAKWDSVVAFCRSHARDWGCSNARQSGSSPDEPDAFLAITAGDPRITTAVLAAPALPAAFMPDGLAMIAAPVQLWIASGDRIVPDAASIAAALPNAPDLRRVEGAGHFAFLTPCPKPLAESGAEFCGDPAGFDRASFLHDFTRAVIGFYGEHLAPR